MGGDHGAGGQFAELFDGCFAGEDAQQRLRPPPAAGGGVGRTAISTNAAANRCVWVRTTPSRWSARYRSRSIRRNASATVAPPIGSRVNSPLTVPSNVVDRRNEPTGGGGSAVPVEFGVGTKRPVAQRLHRLTPRQLAAVSDERRLVTGEQRATTRRRVGEQVDVIGADLPTRPRPRGAGIDTTACPRRRIPRAVPGATAAVRDSRAHGARDPSPRHTERRSHSAARRAISASNRCRARSNPTSSTSNSPSDSASSSAPATASSASPSVSTAPTIHPAYRTGVRLVKWNDEGPTAPRPGRHG